MLAMCAKCYVPAFVCTNCVPIVTKIALGFYLGHAQVFKSNRESHLVKSLRFQRCFSIGNRMNVTAIKDLHYK